MTAYATFDSPVGPLVVTSDGDAVTGLSLPENGTAAPTAPDWVRDESLPVLQAAAAQLAEYFAGSRKEFSLPLAPKGTDFQRRAWEQLQRIPYGATISYGEQARRLGNPSAMRAVGQANGRNPIAIIIPCHRVIGANGTLTGFGGGLCMKETLLRLEGSHAAQTPS